MTSLPQILVYSPQDVDSQPLAEVVSHACRSECIVTQATMMAPALQALAAGDFRGILVVDSHPDHLRSATLLAQSGGVLSLLEDGIAVLDLQSQIVWCNPRFQSLSGCEKSVVGSHYADHFSGETLPGSDPLAFQSVAESGGCADTQLKLNDDRYVHIHVKWVAPLGGEPGSFIVVVRDITTEAQRQRKLHDIFSAGSTLFDVNPDEMRAMSEDNRKEYLKSQIIECTEGLLQYETVEIRLLQPETKQLVSLLNVGMLPEAATRRLFAEENGNGVTGYVAATGTSYFCTDSSNDPRYLKGAEGARSSITVPIKWNNEVMGTFNVESRQVGAFKQQDLLFLEVFGREVAAALNRLNLLSAEKFTTAVESTERMMVEVAQPVDDMLNDAVWILSKYIGHDPAVADKLNQIIRNAREIKRKIKSAGETVAPIIPEGLQQGKQRPRLKDKWVLVADADPEIRKRAHELLEPFGCTVETAHNGAEALLMVRNYQYNAVLADIRLPDMSGSECFRQVRAVRPDVPIVLMTGFGYDPGHSIVKAREMGLRSVLYKPFRQEMFLDEMEKAVNGYGATIVNQYPSVSSASNPPNP